MGGPWDFPFWSGRSAGTRSSTRAGSAGPAAQIPAHDLNATRHGEGDPEREQQPFPGRILKHPPAEVPEQRRVQGPDERRNRVEHGEAPPRERHGARAQGDSGPAAGDEAGNDDQLASALGQLPLGPVQGLLCLAAAKEPLTRPGAESAADQIRSVVAEERATGRGDDDQRQVEAACGGNHARSDHRCLARHHRHEHVKDGEEEDDAVCPPRRLRDKLRKLTEHGCQRHNATATCNRTPGQWTGWR